MGRPSAGYLANKIKQLENFNAQYGATTFVSEETARATDESFIWHVCSLEDSSGWLNGFSQSGEPVDYWKATNPWIGSAGTLYIVTDEFFDCPTCEAGTVSDPDECDECDGYGSIVIDFENVVFEKDGELTEDEIWEMRESQ
jgi:hypothetical protein